MTTLLLHAYMPETTGRLLDALGEPDRELAEFGSRGGGQSLGELAPLFPKLRARAGLSARGTVAAADPGRLKGDAV